MASGSPIRSRLPLAAVLGLMAIGSGGAGAQVSRLSEIELPDGFSITFFAENVTGARSLAQSPGGTVFVGTRQAGLIHALVDSDGDGAADERYQIASGLNSPNGVAFRNASLYVAEISRILRYDGIENRLDSPPQPFVVTDRLPTDTHHGWKFIRFGPDGRLYVPVGAPCNICNEADPYNAILRMAADGSYQIVARGVRNTVGFDWHPVTRRLWFTDNGRDWLGDNSPPDELNVLTSNGQHFGYPFCHGREVSDPEFGALRSCSEFRPPVQELGPHVAALGMRFYTGEMFPERYRGQIFIAEHGSWNRTDPIGYRVMLVRLGAGGQAVGYEEFATGWLQNGTAWGRPVDVMVREDGSLLVSDDRRGAVYRIVHESGGSPEPDPEPPPPDPEPEPDPDPEPDPEPPPPRSDGPCVSSAETLCLHDDRFEVRVEWWSGDGETGSAQVVQEATDDSGLFRFFEADNWEILIKVLNGCDTNGHYWVYGASTTTLGYVIRVTDTATGDVREYRNEPGRPAPAITDARAFPDSCRP
ncbi:MAG: sorbosone dehydrogenase family protein [Holophagales bacterium]|nr:sorbosone dehydrogenase family protein [Holophagales bacterium]MYG29099.1 sorbosone dehydrogenase family protein [Holophagales bacterium]MYI80581.1 sorbosone dehydrogenase family protein [Holophagales bacterium]